MSSSRSPVTSADPLTPEWLRGFVVDALTRGALRESKGRKWGRRGWTSWLKSQLQLAARRRGFRTWAGGLRGRGEYLVDLCWHRPYRASRDYKGLELAAEIEWAGKHKHVMEDFFKLVDMRARARLFVAGLDRAAWRKRFGLVDVASSVVAGNFNARAQDWVVLVLCENARRGDVGSWLLRPGRGAKRMVSDE